MPVGSNKQWTGKAEALLLRLDVELSAIESLIAAANDFARREIVEELADARCSFFRGISDLTRRAGKTEKGDGLPRGRPKRKRSRRSSSRYNPKKKS